MPEVLDETRGTRAEFSRVTALPTRETEVLLHLACFRYLGRSHIEEFIFGGSVHRPRSKEVLTGRVLDRLKTRGLVSTTPRLVGGPNRGSARLGYFLTTAGHKLAGSLIPDLPRRAPAFRGTFLMNHALMTAEIALAFRRTARLHPEHRLIEWECDWQAALRIGLSTLVPDAHFVYRVADGQLDVFLEVDLGTEGTRFFARKISRYLDFYRGGTWRSHLPTWPLVLTVTPTEARAMALRGATEGLLSSQRDAERIVKATEFDFCSLTDLLGPSGPVGAIWQAAGRSGLRSILDVAPEAAVTRQAEA